jgi:predicted ArsR family transcriptional regulator
MDRSAVAAIAALDDDIRHALYQHVRASAGTAVTRESAAEAIGISRKLAAFHLDKLVELGILRSGFGAGPRRVGRAPRLYEAADADIAVRVPERTPELLAEILVEAVVGAPGDEPQPQAEQAALRVARRRGVARGAQVLEQARPGRLGVERATALVQELLTEDGFEPYRAGPAVRLHNCPFHPLAAAAPQFICQLNCEYVAGIVAGLGADGRIAAELAPAPGECCVEIGPPPRV